MNKAHRDGFLSEKFNIPKYLLEKSSKTEKKISFNKRDLIYSINVCTDIYQVQSLSVFVLLLSCGGMNPSDLMNYISVKKEEQKSLINSILFDYKNDYPMAIKQISEWFQQGKLKSNESIFNGIDNFYEIFLKLFNGNKRGKLILKI